MDEENRLLLVEKIKELQDNPDLVLKAQKWQKELDKKGLWKEE